jgi:hypothetical protein
MPRRRGCGALAVPEERIHELVGRQVVVNRAVVVRIAACGAGRVTFEADGGPLVMRLEEVHSLEAVGTGGERAAPAPTGGEAARGAGPAATRTRRGTTPACAPPPGPAARSA